MDTPRWAMHPALVTAKQSDEVALDIVVALLAGLAVAAVVIAAVAVTGWLLGTDAHTAALWAGWISAAATIVWFLKRPDRRIRS